MNKSHCAVMQHLLRLSIFALISLISSIAFAHGQHVNSKPWTACEEAKKDDPCSYIVNEKKLYKGTCQAMSDVLMCVRNVPIETLTVIKGSGSLKFKPPFKNK